LVLRKASGLSGEASTAALAWGFTFIELLVVIAIIATLCGLLLTALARAKARAYEAKCLGNLKQLSVALQLYRDDTHVYPIGTQGQGYGAWQQLLLPSASSNCFFCPQSIHAQSNYVQLISALSPDVLPHYGYNDLGAVWTSTSMVPPNLGLGGRFIPAGLTSSYEALPENAVMEPADMIALGDADAYVKPLLAAHSDVNSLFFIAFPFSIQVPTGQATVGGDIIGSWHNKGANMLFCDCHVEYAKQSEWVSMSNTDRCRWNNDHQPHPEYWGGR
jgi:prepilin-type processing-associated H-X9-DG protein/prepilin-type N-terminal cleavage/methylation domain-containing protein